MFQSVTTRFSWLLAAAFAAVLVSGPAQASGEIGDHVKDLKAHINEYTDEVHWLLEKVHGIVATYKEQGATAARPTQLVDHWEAVKFHAAIETNYVPLYANIWQGLYGLQEAIQKEKPIAEVRRQQAALEQALWQSLGAVKLAAKFQTEGRTPSGGGKAMGPVATIDAIKHNLSEVVIEFAEKEYDEAKELVYETYQTRFEGIEGALIEQDAELVEDLEKDFNVTLPQQLNADGSMEAVKQIVDAMQKKLDRARELLKQAEKNKRDVF
ncbi:hypothetical protein [Thiohalophilus sp.]|uniref:hypothetical protein n=1 Tax=Thiohalophilus sp. TaxID=3028392 RepID=UPI002ACEA47D|nr:hypothetical protein [Thiohalophilus sp.]MDZ7661424.1 hypothetical protein [Thiohalophilus sp.]